jgi:hypothetical protein
VSWLGRVARLLASVGRPAAVPPPNKVALLDDPAQRVLEVRYSHDDTRRVIITQDGSGIFRVHEHLWDASDWDVGGTPYWAYHHTAHTDTLQKARTLADEALSREGGGAH